MAYTQTLNLRWDEILRILRQYPRRWMVPAVAVAVLAVVYAATYHRSWEATQALIVRDEAANNADGPGRFRQPEDMKTTQETILELAKSRAVLAAALSEVGPPADAQNPHNWPTADDIAELREVLKISPPKGTEFGTTEIFYVQLKDHDRARAVALVTAVCHQLQDAFQQLRNEKAQGMIAELSRNVALAQADLTAATQRLAELEESVGSDLGELRNLYGSQSSESDLRRKVINIEADLRAIESEQRENDELLALLRSAQQDPTQLVATPSRLLTAQPALNRLKEGLIDAQIRTARLLGEMSEQHPKVRAARNEVSEIGQHIHNELAIAIRGIEAEQRVHDSHATALQDELVDARARLDRLAGLRSEYANRVGEVERRTRLLETAERNLADVRASEAAASTAALINPIDTPDTGHKPQGPGRATILLGGILGGLCTGLGVLFFTVQPVQTVAVTQIPVSPSQPQAAPVNGSPVPAAVAPGSLSLKQSLAKLAGQYAEATTA